MPSPTEYVKYGNVRDIVKSAMESAKIILSKPESIRTQIRIGAILQSIDGLPADDVVPRSDDYVMVVHAKWKPYDACETEENVYECTNCGFVLQLMEGTPESNEYIGCPRCLARMDGNARD